MNTDIIFHSIENFDVTVDIYDDWARLYFADRKLTLSLFAPKSLEAIRDAITEALENQPKACEICLEQSFSIIALGTEMVQDRQGNDVWVCEEHAEELHSQTPEREADEAAGQE